MLTEYCVAVCSVCGNEVKAIYTHKNQKVYCTGCNKPLNYIIVKEVLYYD